MTNKTTDSFGRIINYLRMSITDRCNLRCKYCMPESGIPKKEHSQIMRCEEIIAIAKAFSELGVSKIRLTGGEPLVRLDIEEIISGIKREAKPDILAMTTNAILLGDRLEGLRKAGLTRLNISLDTLRDDRFSEITRVSNLSAPTSGIVDIIERAIKLDFESIKLNTVLIGGFNQDEIPDIVRLAEIYPIDVRFIELMPIGEAATWSKARFVKVESVLEAVKGLKSVEASDKSSPARYFRTDNMKGKVGLIDPISCSFCENCNRVRVTPDGKLKTCLHGEEEYDILSVYRKEGAEEMKKLIIKAIEFKPESHNMDTNSFVPIQRSMYKIGG